MNLDRIKCHVTIGGDSIITLGEASTGYLRLDFDAIGGYSAPAIYLIPYFLEADGGTGAWETGHITAVDSSSLNATREVDRYFDGTAIVSGGQLTNCTGVLSVTGRSANMVATGGVDAPVSGHASAVAIGAGAVALSQQSIAIGAGAVARKKGMVSIGASMQHLALTVDGIASSPTQASIDGDTNVFSGIGTGSGLLNVRAVISVGQMREVSGEGGTYLQAVDATQAAIITLDYMLWHEDTMETIPTTLLGEPIQSTRFSGTNAPISSITVDSNGGIWVAMPDNTTPQRTIIALSITNMSCHPIQVSTTPEG